MQQLEESELMVSDGVQRALQGGHGGAGDTSPDWSDWALVEDPSFPTLESLRAKILCR